MNDYCYWYNLRWWDAW